MDLKNTLIMTLGGAVIGAGMGGKKGLEKGLSVGSKIGFVGGIAAGILGTAICMLGRKKIKEKFVLDEEYVK